jgi:hypothetical protein
MVAAAVCGSGGRLEACVCVRFDVVRIADY